MGWTTPKVWNVGDPGTSSDLNAYVGQNTAYLYGDTTWSSPSFVNSWGNFSGYPARYRRLGATVVLGGAVVGGASGSIAFTLPTGYQPAANGHFPVATNSTTSQVYVSVATSGSVTVQGISSGAWVGLDGIVASLI